MARGGFMLTFKCSHKEYQGFVQEFLRQYYIQNNRYITVLIRSDLVIKLWISDLTKIVTLLKGQYSSSNKGAPPKDPVALLRSLLLMSFSGETSISNWVVTLKSNPFYAILSGFLPACFHPTGSEEFKADSIPGVGTFYDFMDRLIVADFACNKPKLKKPKRKPSKKQKKNVKMKSSKPGVVARIVKRILKQKGSKLPNKPETLLNKVLKDLFVMPSASMGLLSDTQKLNIAGDGTTMPSNASHYGKKVCDCKLKPGKHCDCPRLFSDPTASFGWDSFKEQYFYGHSFHGFTASDSFYSLPIHIKCITGKRHDSVTGCYHLKELIDSYPEFKFHSAAFDSAYDAVPFYNLLDSYSIAPIIKLNSRNSKPEVKEKLVELDCNGIPHCRKLGHKLRNWGLIKKSFRRKWLFPVQCDSCTKCDVKSSKSIYLKTDNHPRFFLPILRDSLLFRYLYKRRSTTERAWDRIKNDFNAAKAVTISKSRRIVKVFLGAFCCFIDTWACESKLTILDIFPELEDVMAA